jgi:predicted RNA-binding protein with PUA-like domain
MVKAAKGTKGAAKVAKPVAKTAAKPAKAVANPVKPVTKPANSSAKGASAQPAQYWLMKSEPDVYAITDLERDGSTGWEGVRNYQARNFMRDSMRLGDLVLFYHSNAEPPGVAGIARVAGAPEPDPTQFDAGSDYHDPGSDPADPRWLHVRVGFVERFAEVVPLEVLRADASLTGMPLLARGQRLSVQPVSPAHFARVLALAGAVTRV